MTRSGPTAQEQAERRLGTVLRDRYRIERILGGGGMATVYLAVHRNGNRVALKILRPELSVHDAHRERFVREAYVANSLEHPGAVRVIDDDVAEDGCPFLVMELLQGETLEARLRRCGRLAPREALAVAHALCGVLARAHACGVVHRDIKPDNLFLTTEGALKVLDFGIAAVRQEGQASGTQTGHLLGTPAYMPPEQALGRRHEIDGRTDLWSVGATMFALLAGRAVHQADAPEEIVVRAAMLPAPPLAEFAPEVPAAICAVVDRALAFARGDRFPDAAAMQAALAAAHVEAFGEPIEATRLPPGPLPTGTLTLAPGEAAATLAAETAVSDAGQALTVADMSAPRAGPPAPSSPPAASHSGAGPAAAGSGATQSAVRRRARARWLGAVGGLALAGVAAAAIAAVARSGAGPAGCTTNAACVAEAGGRAAICRKDQGRCVALETELCEVIAEPGDVADEATLWIGAMYPAGEAVAAYGIDGRRCVELARRDFVALTGGLPSTRPGGRARPIGVVACDDSRDHERSAAHLVDEVGVPAILGFGRSKEVLELAREHFVPKGVLALASNTAAMLSSIPHPPGEPRLVYRVTTSATMVAPPAVAFTREVGRALRGEGGEVGPAGTLRIAILGIDNVSGLSHVDALLSGLAETRAPAEREEVRQFVVPDADGPELPGMDRIAAEVAAFAPHVVLDGGASAWVIAGIERAWSAGPRPRYVFGGVDLAALRASAAAEPGFVGRFSSISTRESAARGKVQARYVAAFGPSDEAAFSPTPYDAFYVLAYAAIAVGDAPVTGRSLARAIGRLVPPGEPIEVGPAGIYPALKVLGRGGSVDLQGTLTTLDFDPETGDATAEFALFCLDGEAARLVETDTRYDAATRSFVGSRRCGGS